jgi:hypothetical protein
MHTSHSDLSLQSAEKKPNWNLLIVGVVTITAIALVCLLIYSGYKQRSANSAGVRAKSPVAELVSATGIVLAGKPDRTEWNQVTIGARLMEGDLIQTDQSGTASIRYANGTTVAIQANTILAVRNPGGGRMDIGLPHQEANSSPVSSTSSEQQNPPDAVTSAGNGMEPAAFDKANGDEAHPYMQLSRIIPFGRSLELIGKVEAGSQLTVNDEIVDISGDGSFKHFTKPFPVSTQKVSLVMKVTDLASRSRVETATYDFNPHGGI